MKSFWIKKTCKKSVILIFVVAISLSVMEGQGQPKLSIRGQLKDRQNQAMAFATVALRRMSDSTLVTGTSSNAEGEFSIGSITPGKYCLLISAIGYNSITRNIDLINNYNTGPLILEDKSVTLGEIVVVGERIKAKADPDKTTYFINKKITDVSNSGVDMLNYIPGVKVDIMKNISLEGSKNIVILVDGKERDRNFLSQLNSSRIDKVEVISAPGSKYDADVTGVLNIILKKEKESGINGHIHAEVPTSESEIYVFPDYSFNYSFNKLNLYTSYNGDLSYFNIVESSIRNISDPLGITEIVSNQYVRQKYWSHRFHYGFDYIFNEKNQINFYGYYNPYSSEHSGNVEMQVSGDKVDDVNWRALKQDADMNRSSFYSVYYKHIFDKPGREIAFDFSYSGFKAENSTTYTTTYSLPDSFLTSQVNSVKPKQNSESFKVDYTSPISDKLKFDAGVKARFQYLQDRQSDAFKYDESIFALYGAFTYNFSKYTLSTGLRAERSTSGLTNSFKNDLFALLPDATLNYKFSKGQNIKLSYSRTVSRPNIYELNPYTSIDDPFSTQSGNPDLKPEFRQNFSIDYSKTFGDNYLSFQLYYKTCSNAISNYTFINDAGIFESHVGNLGDIRAFGGQISGALKLHKAISLNPYINISNVATSGNSIPLLYDIENRHKIGFESGLSAIFTFKNDIAASLQFQYATPSISFQNNTFVDAIYFFTLEKTFKQKIKVGIKSILPFTRSFTYQGNEIRGMNFYSHTEGNIKLSAFPVLINFSYQFNSGKAFNKITHNKEDIDIMPKKGF